jgi:hypothetical protein
MKISILTIIIVTLLLITLFLLFSKKKETYKLRPPPKLSLVPVTNTYKLKSLYLNYIGYYYADYYTNDLPEIYSLIMADDYTALGIMKGFETTPVYISWNDTSYINEQNYVFVDSFELNCGNYCNINNQIFRAYCTSGNNIFCDFNAQSAIGYSAVESPLIWPRYFSRYSEKRKSAADRAKNGMVKYSNPPTLMTLIVTAQYNPN